MLAHSYQEERLQCYTDQIVISVSSLILLVIVLALCLCGQATSWRPHQEHTIISGSVMCVLALVKFRQHGQLFIRAPGWGANYHGLVLKHASVKNRRQIDWNALVDYEFFFCFIGINLFILESELRWHFSLIWMRCFTVLGVESLSLCNLKGICQTSSPMRWDERASCSFLSFFIITFRTLIWTAGENVR